MTSRASGVFSGHGQTWGNSQARRRVGPRVQGHLDDLRDHVAGPLDHHGVTEADVQAGDLVGVVQGGVGHRDAADRHWLEPRHRRDRPGAADLQVDGFQDRAGPLGRKLAGDGPARRARHETQPALPLQVIDLVDDPVDVEAQRGPQDLELGIDVQQPLRVLDPLGRRGRGHEAPLSEHRKRAPLAVGERLGHQAPGIGEELQRPLGADLRIDLAQRAGGEVARIGIGALTSFLGGLIEGGEGLQLDIDLAAHLDHVGPARALQAVGDVGDGAQVGGDVLTHPAIAARRALDQHAFLVAQRSRQAIDLGLGRIGDGVGRRETQETPNPRVELDRLVVGEGVVEAEHRHAVLDRGELLGPRRANPHGW